MPSIADRLEDRGHASGFDLVARGHEIGVCRRDAGDPCLLEGVLVVDDDPITAVDVPDLLAIHLAINGRLGDSGGIFPLHPLFVRQIERVRLNVVIDLEVGHAALTHEDVWSLARVELGLEDLEVVVGWDDLVVDVDASLVLELLGELWLGSPDPILAGKHRQGDLRFAGTATAACAERNEAQRDQRDDGAVAHLCKTPWVCELHHRNSLTQDAEWGPLNLGAATMLDVAPEIAKLGILHLRGRASPFLNGGRANVAGRR